MCCRQGSPFLCLQENLSDTQHPRIHNLLHTSRHHQPLCAGFHRLCTEGSHNVRFQLELVQVEQVLELELEQVEALVLGEVPVLQTQLGRMAAR